MSRYFDDFLFHSDDPYLMTEQNQYYGALTDEFIAHHGILGQRWGVRRFQNYDGSLIKKGNDEKVKKQRADSLIDEMNTKWDYGVYKDGKHITDLSDFDWSTYRTTPVNKLEKEKCGVCWDFVNYQHYKLDKEKIPNKSYMFTMLKNNGELITHTFTTCDIGNKTYWLESAMWSKRGVHEIKDLKDVVSGIKDNYKTSTNEKTKWSLFEYNPDGLDAGLTDQEYFDRTTQNLVLDNSK